MSRFVLQIFAIKSRSRRKTEQMQKFLAPNFLPEGRPQLLRQIVIAIYRPPFGKVWLSSICWSPYAKPGNEVEIRFYVEWVKIGVKFKAVIGPKFMSFLDILETPCSCQRTCPIMYVMFLSGNIDDQICR